MGGGGGGGGGEGGGLMIYSLNCQCRLPKFPAMNNIIEGRAP